LQIQIKEDSTSCTAIGTTCVDPQGGRVNYTRDGSSDAALFDVSGAPNNSLIICPVDSLIGKVGTYQVYMIKKNENKKLQSIGTVPNPNPKGAVVVVIVW